MGRFQDGEALAFDELIDRHKRSVFGYLRQSARSSADADDLFQEVFLRVIRATPTWQPRATVRTWLFTIARNVLIDAARKRGSAPPTVSLTEPPAGAGPDAPSPLDRLAVTTPAVDQSLVEREHQEAIEALVIALPDEQRDAFLLKREGLTFDEIATIAGTSGNTIKSRLRYALQKLRQGLAERGLLERRKETCR